MSKKADCIWKLMWVVLAVMICVPPALAADKPAAEPGKICLQSERSKMEFRNISLIPIIKQKAKAADAGTK